MTDYENLSIEQLESLSLKYIRRNRAYGGKWEGDPSINDISRALIEAVRREKGACFLTNANLTGKDRDNPHYRFTPYTGQAIYNFDYAYALPTEDESLRQMIVERNQSTGNESYALVQRISYRVQEIGGFFLLWV